MADGNDDPLPDYPSFLAIHQPQLMHYNVPQPWHRLHRKLVEGTFDAGSAFSLSYSEDDGWSVVVCKEDGIEAFSDIWLVDHAFTFQSYNVIKDALIQIPGLDKRLSALLHEGEPGSEPVLSWDELVAQMWKVTYKFKIGGNAAATTEGEQGGIDCFYVMDELGSRFQHHCDPENADVEICPFLYMDAAAGYTSYSLVWPIRRLEHGDKVERTPLPNCPKFSSAEYWNQTYNRRHEKFEWYCEFDQLIPIFEAMKESSGAMLVPGCGNSDLSKCAADYGFSVHSFDISESVIEAMEQKYEEESKMTWQVLGFEEMGVKLKGKQYNVVLDKGAIDAVLADASEEEFHRLLKSYFSGVRSLLQRNGIFVIVSCNSPDRLLPIVQHDDLHWDVKVGFVAPKANVVFPSGEAATQSIPHNAKRVYCCQSF